MDETTRNIVSFVAGFLFMLVNVVLLKWAWKRILWKKSIALAVGAIVFKYALFGFLLFGLIYSQKVNAGYFLAGVTLMVLVTVIKSTKQTKEDNGSL